ncbi:MAG: chemotaxis protein CheW [Gemmatimonadota bacterium]|nr:chemotaxis protein CheW [Gemmatimonadota bacterium]
MKKKRTPTKRTTRRRAPKTRAVAETVSVADPVPVAPVAELVSPPSVPPQRPLDDDEPSAPRRRLLREVIAAGEGQSDTLVFRVGPERFALDLPAVEEAIELPSVHHLPEMPEHMLGVFELRGRLVPIYSPERVLRVKLTREAAAVLVFRSGNKRLGLAVDDVDDVLTVDGAGVRRVPVPDNKDNVLLGVIRRGADLLSLVDAASLALGCLADPLTEAA